MDAMSKVELKLAEMRAVAAEVGLEGDPSHQLAMDHALNLMRQGANVGITQPPDEEQEIGWFLAGLALGATAMFEVLRAMGEAMRNE
jgi:hypothetical protein